MKKLAIELRMYIAETLLGWAFDISPKTEEAFDIKLTIFDYFNRQVNALKKNSPSDKP